MQGNVVPRDQGLDLLYELTEDILGVLDIYKGNDSLKCELASQDIFF